jgi:hypothetical protein
MSIIALVSGTHNRFNLVLSSLSGDPLSSHHKLFFTPIFSFYPVVPVSHLHWGTLIVLSPSVLDSVKWTASLTESGGGSMLVKEETYDLQSFIKQSEKDYRSSPDEWEMGEIVFPANVDLSPHFSLMISTLADDEFIYRIALYIRSKACNVIETVKKRLILVNNSTIDFWNYESLKHNQETADMWKAVSKEISTAY